VVDAIAVNMAQLHGWKFGLCSFENTPEDNIAKICEKYLGMPFWHGMGAPRMGEGDLHRAMAWAQEHFYFIRAEDESPTIDWVLETARAAVMRYGIRGIILDPYNEFEHKRPHNQNETEYISEILSKVKRFAVNHGVHIWFVAHPAKPDSKSGGEAPGLYAISGSAHWVNKADIGLSAHRAWEPDGRRSNITEVHVKKVRFRHQGEPGIAKLRFDSSTGQYTEALL
jgi:twinkle protein